MSRQKIHTARDRLNGAPLSTQSDLLLLQLLYLKGGGQGAGLEMIRERWRRHRIRTKTMQPQNSLVRDAREGCGRGQKKEEVTWLFLMGPKGETADRSGHG